MGNCEFVLEVVLVLLVPILHYISEQWYVNDFVLPFSLTHDDDDDDDDDDDARVAMLFVLIGKKTSS
jgi:hypothetical protein